MVRTAIARDAFLAATLLAACTTIGDPWVADPAGGGDSDYETHVRPILLARDCASRGCHGGGTASGGLSVDSLEAILAGGDSGPAIVPCDVPGSLLLGRIADPPDPPPRMPLTENYLSTDEIALLTRWVAEGAGEDFDPAACADPAEPVDYETAVRPLFETWGCAGCHPGGGGLSVESLADLLVGGDSGPAVTPCDGEGSLLVGKLRGTAPGDQMPLDGPPYLGESDIALIAAWIDQGAAAVYDPEACP